MKLLSMRVVDFRGIVDQTVDFGDGITIVAGRNEVGKSSLVDAFDYLLEYKATSNAKQIKRAQPIGRDAGPAVEAEFILGDDHVSYRKRWLSNRETVLTFNGGPRAGRQLSGDAAHDAAQELWDSLDSQLWKASRLMQATELEQSALTACSSLQRALDEQAGGAADDASSGPLVDRVSAEVDKFYTTTGLERTVLKNARARVEEAEARLASAQRAQDELAGLVDDLVDLENEVADREAGLAEQAAELEEIAARAAAARAHQEKLDAAKLELETAQRDLDDAEQKQKARTALVTRASEAQRALEDLVGSESRSRESLAPLEESIASSRAKISGVKQKLRALKTDLDAARRFDRQSQTRSDIDRIETQLADCDRLTAEIARLESSIIPIDGEALDAIVELDQKIAIAEAAARAGAAQVRIESLSGAKSLLICGEEQTVGPEAVDQAVLSELVIELPGELRLTITPDSGAGDSGRDLDRMKEERADILDRTGYGSASDLKEAVRKCDEDTQLLDRTRERRADRLEGRDEGSIRDELSLLRASLEQHDGGVEGDIDALSERQDALETELATAEKILDDQLEEADRLRSGLAEMTGQVTNQKAVLTRASDDLADARARCTDEALAESVEKALRRFAASQAKSREAEEKLAESGGAALISDYELQLKHVEGLRALLADVKRDAAIKRGVLESKNRHGIQEDHDQAGSELDRAAAECRSLLSHAEAAKLLADVLKKHQQETHRRYIEPFRAALQRLGRATYQDPSFDIELSEDLKVTARLMGGTRIPFDSLSTGAKEQISILIRLATASLVSPDDAVPVLFDDTLGYSDRKKLRRVVDAIGSSGDAGQIIIFTANEDRFAGLTNAERVTL